ncbi:MAG: hypothetical protein V2A58_01950 [Planctomycetota bacterium]
MVSEAIVSYYGADRHHVGEDLRDIVDHGCTGIVFCVTEVALRLFPAKIEAVFDEAARRGVDVYVNFWSLGNIFATDRFPSEFVWRHPDVAQVAIPGASKLTSGAGDEYANIPRACFRNPRFRDYAVGMITRFFGGHPCKGYFLDEPRSGYCMCPSCRDWYRRRFGAEIPQEVTGACPQELEQSRMDIIVDCLATMSAAAREADERLVRMLCVSPPVLPGMDERYYETLFNIDSVDNVGTDPYWRMFGRGLAWVTECSQMVARLARKLSKRTHIWIQCVALPAGAEREIPGAAERAAAQGIDILAAWGYRGEISTNERCENCDEVWQQLGKAFRRLSCRADEK